MYNRDQTNIINTINNISAFGKAHAFEYNFEDFVIQMSLLSLL